MTVDTRKTPTGTIIGTSRGLATQEFSGKGCEQVYVKETGDEQRPIRLEFWVGYGVEGHAVLTRSQAIEMAHIILGWAAPPLSVLTEMIRAEFPEAGGEFDSLLTENEVNSIKAVFRKWLREVGLPEYRSIGRGGDAFSSSNSIRQLLINLVDEPSGSRK